MATRRTVAEESTPVGKDREATGRGAFTTAMRSASRDRTGSCLLAEDDSAIEGEASMPSGALSDATLLESLLVEERRLHAEREAKALAILELNDKVVVRLKEELCQVTQQLQERESVDLAEEKQMSLAAAELRWAETELTSETESQVRELRDCLEDSELEAQAQWQEALLFRNLWQQGEQASARAKQDVQLLESRSMDLQGRADALEAQLHLLMQSSREEHLEVRALTAELQEQSSHLLAVSASREEDDLPGTDQAEELVRLEEALLQCQRDLTQAEQELHFTRRVGLSTQAGSCDDQEVLAELSEELQAARKTQSQSELAAERQRRQFRQQIQDVQSQLARVQAAGCEACEQRKLQDGLPSSLQDHLAQHGRAFAKLTETLQAEMQQQAVALAQKLEEHDVEMRLAACNASGLEGKLKASLAEHKQAQQQAADTKSTLEEATCRHERLQGKLEEGLSHSRQQVQTLESSLQRAEAARGAALSEQKSKVQSLEMQLRERQEQLHTACRSLEAPQAAGQTARVAELTGRVLILLRSEGIEQRRLARTEEAAREFGAQTSRLEESISKEALERRRMEKDALKHELQAASCAQERDTMLLELRSLTSKHASLEAKLQEESQTVQRLAAADAAWRAQLEKLHRQHLEQLAQQREAGERYSEKLQGYVESAALPEQAITAVQEAVQAFSKASSRQGVKPNSLAFVREILQQLLQLQRRFALLQIESDRWRLQCQSAAGEHAQHLRSMALLRQEASQHETSKVATSAWTLAAPSIAVEADRRARAFDAKLQSQKLLLQERDASVRALKSELNAKAQLAAVLSDQLESARADDAHKLAAAREEGEEAVLRRRVQWRDELVQHCLAMTSQHGDSSAARELGLELALKELIARLEDATMRSDMFALKSASLKAQLDAASMHPSPAVPEQAGLPEPVAATAAMLMNDVETARLEAELDVAKAELKAEKANCEMMVATLKKQQDTPLSSSAMPPSVEAARSQGSKADARATVLHDSSRHPVAHDIVIPASPDAAAPASGSREPLQTATETSQRKGEPDKRPQLGSPVGALQHNAASRKTARTALPAALITLADSPQEGASLGTRERQAPLAAIDSLVFPAAAPVPVSSPVVEQKSAGTQTPQVAAMKQAENTSTQTCSVLAEAVVQTTPSSTPMVVQTEPELRSTWAQTEAEPKDPKLHALEELQAAMVRRIQGVIGVQRELRRGFATAAEQLQALRDGRATDADQKEELRGTLSLRSEEVASLSMAESVAATELLALEEDCSRWSKHEEDQRVTFAAELAHCRSDLEETGLEATAEATESLRVAEERLQEEAQGSAAAREEVAALRGKLAESEERLQKQAEEEGSLALRAQLLDCEESARSEALHELAALRGQLAAIEEEVAAQREQKKAQELVASSTESMRPLESSSRLVSPRPQETERLREQAEKELRSQCTAIVLASESAQEEAERVHSAREELSRMRREVIDAKAALESVEAEVHLEQSRFVLVGSEVAAKHQVADEVCRLQAEGARLRQALAEQNERTRAREAGQEKRAAELTKDGEDLRGKLRSYRREQLELEAQLASAEKNFEQLQAVRDRRLVGDRKQLRDEAAVLEKALHAERQEAQALSQRCQEEVVAAQRDDFWLMRELAAARGRETALLHELERLRGLVLFDAGQDAVAAVTAEPMIASHGAVERLGMQERDRSELQSEARRLKKQLADERQRREQLRSRLTTCEKEAEALKQKGKDTETQLRMHKDEAERRRALIESLQQRCAAADVESKEEQETLREAEETAKKLQVAKRDLGKRDSAIRELGQELGAARKVRAELEEQLRARDTRVEAQSSRIRVLTTQAQQKDATLKEARTEVLALQSALRREESHARERLARRDSRAGKEPAARGQAHHSVSQPPKVEAASDAPSVEAPGEMEESAFSEPLPSSSIHEQHEAAEQPRPPRLPSRLWESLSIDSSALQDSLQILNLRPEDLDGFLDASTANMP
eukprot:TRINITY_DN34153_c0_g1_i2.p1 TRINITY_DN34153_c0_g1~~TRINITY_DN34153_c0_g1_i2.p1  ORF type:complete len:1989 (+),score=598.47 TRINITY_DN34153_c0_g1_i2:202-6168(+)